MYQNYQKLCNSNKKPSIQGTGLSNLSSSIGAPNSLEEFKFVDFSVVTCERNEKENKSTKNGSITPNRFQVSSQNNGGYTPNSKNEYPTLSANPRVSLNNYQLFNPQNFTTAALQTSIDQLSSVRAVHFDAENHDDKKQHYLIGSTSPSQFRNSQNLRQSNNEMRNIIYDHGSPSKNSMSDISIKILNEILNSPITARQGTKQSRTQQQLQSSTQGLSRKKSPQQSKSPLNSSRCGPFNGQLNSSYSNNDILQLKSQRSIENNRKEEQYKLARNSSELSQNNNQVFSTSPNVELQYIKDKIKEKKNLIESKKSELEFIMAKISNQINACKINSIIENALVAKCGENKKKIDSMSIQQIQEKKEIAKLEEQCAKNKYKIINLQSKLEIIKQQEQRYFILKEKKIKEVKEEFQKKNSQMSLMFNEVSQQYQEFIENLDQIEENHNIDLETKAFLKEDLNGKLIQRAEIVAQKEDLEQIFEQFIHQYPEEYEYINEAQKIDCAIEDIKRCLENQAKEQARFTHQKSLLMNKLKEKESYFNHYSSKLEDLAELIKSEKCYSTQALEQSEAVLTRLSTNYNLPDLEIMCCNFILVLSGNFFNQNGPAIQQIVQGLRYKQSKYFFQQLFIIIYQIFIEVNLLELIQLQQVNQYLKLMFIFNDLLGGITLYKLIEYFQSTYLNGMNQEQDSFIENLNILFTSLVHLEDINEKYFNEEQDIVHQISKYNEELESIQKEQGTIQSRIEYLQQQIINDSEMLKKSEQSKLVLNENLKIPVKKSAEIVFQQYCDKQKDQFDQIANEHGEEQVENLIKDHRDQFLYLMTIQQQERMQRMKEIKEEKVQLEKSVFNNINIVENDILPKLKSLVQELSHSKMQLDMMHNDLDNYKDAKQKVEEDMKLLEKCLIQKINDIENNLKQQFSDVIGKSDTIEAELSQETNQLKESTVSIEKIKQSIESNRQLEQTLRDEINKLQQKKKLIDDLRSQTTTVQQETCRRELEIAELEKQIAKFEVRKLVLENPQELTEFSQETSIENLSCQNSNYYNQNQKSHSKSYLMPNESSQQNIQQQQPKNIYINYSSQVIPSSGRISAQSALIHKCSIDYSNSLQSTNVTQNKAQSTHSQYIPNTNLMKQSDLISSSLSNIQQYSPINSQREIEQNNQKSTISTASSSNNITAQSISSNSQSASHYNPQSSQISIVHQYQSASPIVNGINQIQQSLNGQVIKASMSSQNFKQQLQNQSNAETNLQNKGFAQRINQISNSNNNNNTNLQRASQSKSPFGSPRDKVVYYPNTCRTSYVQQTTFFHSNTNVSNSYSKINQQNSPKNKSTWK